MYIQSMQRGTPGMETEIAQALFLLSTNFYHACTLVIS